MNPPTTPRPVPLTVIKYRLKMPDSKEINRLLGRDLVDALRKQKGQP
jgi:hypothetical protein